MIIHSISGPRNISTALMYSFAQRTDIIPLDEPFYASYLKVNPALSHPGREDILKSQSTDPATVAERITQLNQDGKHVYVKDMAHHFVDMNLPPFPESKAIFLVRNPAKLIASFQKVIPLPSLKDIGLEEEWKLFQQYKNADLPAFVIPTEQLAENPRESLNTLCEALDIPMGDKMLSWSAGPKAYDGCWSQYWYSNAHKSTGFTPFQSNYSQLNSHGEELLERALPHYQSLLENSLL